MIMKKKKVLVVAGPTAVGKSDFAIELAKKYHGEIISGDSIQVYQGLDIGSGKVTEAEKQGIPHHLLDIFTPAQSYNVSVFQKMARECIELCQTLPIICGGTGLYLKSCLYDYVFTEEDQDNGTDESLNQYDNETLYKMLCEKDPAQAEKIHPNNRRRLLRSLTIYLRNGQKQSEIVENQEHEMIYDAWIVGCTMERSKLYERINMRVEKMFQMGLQTEVTHLLETGVKFTDPCMKGIGYREWQNYFEGSATVEEVKAEIQKHSRQFAKRQYTWFHHQMPVHWVDMTDPSAIDTAIKEIDQWLNDCSQ